VPGLLEPWNDAKDKWQVATDEFKVCAHCTRGSRLFCDVAASWQSQVLCCFKQLHCLHKHTMSRTSGLCLLHTYWPKLQRGLLDLSTAPQ
jgi:hypothetical protein